MHPEDQVVLKEVEGREEEQGRELSPLDPRLEDHYQRREEAGDSATESKTEQSDDMETAIYVDFKENDPTNPFSFSRRKKWGITLLVCFYTGLSASASSSFAIANPSMKADLSAPTILVNLSLGVYALGFGIVPLITASFSEEFGRRPLYTISAFVFLMMHVGIALSQNIQSVIIFRFLKGAAGSTGATMVGGTIADIWATHERGLPMSVFALAAVGATGLGPVCAGWIELNPHLQWRWVQWIHVIASGIYFIILWFTLPETRGGVLLMRKARHLRRTTDDSRYRARIEEERQSMKKLIWISCTRPLHLLISEPVVASFSLWIGFAWGILYGQIESISLVFSQLYHFNAGQLGMMFLSMFIGALLGFIANLYQEALYRRYAPTRGPEARLISACVAGALFPIGCFIYAWTSFSDVSWIGPFIGLTVFIFAVFIMYLAVFSYLADCYLIYASSALAGQSLCRNIAGTVFPLFSDSMYHKLTFKWASTLLGCIALLMAPIPLVLFFWGPKIRAKSHFAKRLERWKEEQSRASKVSAV